MCLTLAYLCGSHARGTANAVSDLDVAVLLELQLSKEERFDCRLALRRSISDALTLDDEQVDPVILADRGVLEPGLADRLLRAKGFGNVLAHAYVVIDLRALGGPSAERDR